MLRRHIQIHAAKLANVAATGCISFAILALFAACSTTEPPTAKNTQEVSDQLSGASFRKPWAVRSAGEGELGPSCFLDNKRKLAYFSAGSIFVVDLDDPAAVMNKITSLPTASTLGTLVCDTQNRALYYSYRTGENKNYEIASFHVLSGERGTWSKLLGFEGDFTVSPDGRWLLLSMIENGDSELFALTTRSRTAQPKRFFLRKGDDGAPNVAPNNRRFAWRGRRAERRDLSDLYVADLKWSDRGPEIKNIKNLTVKGHALYLSPTWLPDSQQLIFSSDRGARGNLLLYRANLEFDCVQRITNSSGDDLYPTISKNGNELSWTHRSPRQVFVAPLQVSAPCNGQAATREPEDVLFKGVDGR